MDTATFLAQIVAPGPFLCVDYKPQNRGMGQQFFERADTAEATRFICWADGKNMDAYVALASFTVARPETTKYGRTIYKGERTFQNCNSLICFWYDADISRPGDNKRPQDVFASLQEAQDWAAALSMPPTLHVRSGYGVHFYWPLDQALARDDWVPRAHQMKAWLVANGARGDVGITTDCVRILRPPETRNWKVPTQPMPVKVIHWTGQTYDIATIDQELSAFPAVAAATHRTGTGSNVVAIAGNLPAAFQSRQSGAGAAVQQNLPVGRRPHFMEHVATRCEQIKLSLTVAGKASESRDFWYWFTISLCATMEDGQQWAHILSQGDPRYDPVEVDEFLALAKKEQQNKGRLGAPTCAMADQKRPGVCQSCAFYQKLKSPFSLGLLEFDLEQVDMPEGYRRRDSVIYKVEVKNDASNNQFEDLTPVIRDIFNEPEVERVETGLRLHFTIDGRMRFIDRADLLDARTGRKAMSQQDIDLPSGARYDRCGVFLMAWIDKLRDFSLIQSIKPFQWHKDDLAIADRIYSRGAAPRMIPVIEHKSLIESFVPKGSLAEWQSMIHAVITGRPDIQIMVATGFGSVLTPFSEFGGLSANFYSNTGYAKSTALKAMMSIWGDPNTAIFRMDDTVNFQTNRMAVTRFLPVAYDEIHLDDRDTIAWINRLFRIAEGHDKHRLSKDINERTGGSWRSIMTMCSNQNIAQIVAQAHRHSDAAVARMVPIEVTSRFTRDPSVVAKLQNNHGVAGAAYAQYLVDHFDAKTLTELVAKTVEKVRTRYQVTPEERFWSGYCALAILGAQIASNAGIVNFDVPTMVAELERSLDNLRVVVAKQSLGDVLKELINAHNILITDVFAGRSNNARMPLRIDKIQNLNTAEPTQIYIAIEDAKLRANDVLVDRWLRKNSIYRRDDFICNGSRIINTARVGKFDGALGKIDRVLEVDLDAPEFQYIRDYYRENVSSVNRRPL